MVTVIGRMVYLPSHTATRAHYSPVAHTGHQESNKCGSEQNYADATINALEEEKEIRWHQTA